MTHYFDIFTSIKNFHQNLFNYIYQSSNNEIYYLEKHKTYVYCTLPQDMLCVDIVRNFLLKTKA